VPGFRFSRRKFLERSAGAATLGLTACAGGTTVGNSLPNAGSGTGGSGGTGGTGTSPTAVPTNGATPAPGATATPSPGTTATPVPFPAETVSNGSRGPGSLPDSSRPAGQADATLPFDTVVVIMMENHSFDNYLGMLAKRGQPLADGFTFDAAGNPTNKNPLKGGYEHVFRLPSTCQAGGVDQSWAATHQEVNNGAMDGFAPFLEAMGYWDEPDIPFYYSLAKTFCVGNRSFCSTMSQTYPNRRFLYAATASGLNETSSATFSVPAPPAGTFADLLTKYGVSWKNYFTDLPAMAIVPQDLENHPTNFVPSAQFLVDAAAGQLPNVSFVDPEFGAVDDVGGTLFSGLQSIPDLPASVQASLNALGNATSAQGGDEESPQDIAIGEAFVSQIINAAMASPQWKSMLVIWTYDEHGGYYDHVPPAGAVRPDNIPPTLAAGDPAGEYNFTGARIPTVVASPYSKPNAVSNVPHDHTAILATIETKWNLPALTYRDAQSGTLFDYLNLSSPPAFAKPPTLAAPANPGLVNGTCTGTAPAPIISPDAKVPQPTVPRRRAF